MNENRAEALERALRRDDPSDRLRSALRAGTFPAAEDVPVLVRACETEPDFFVRDMLTWALTRHRAEAVVPLLLKELRSAVPQARSQALHSLSKIGDDGRWAALRATLWGSASTAAVDAPRADETSALDAVEGGSDASASGAAVCPGLLQDADDEVARAAWRTAAALAPDEDRAEVAHILVTQLGRGDASVQKSLSRALVDLGAAGDTAVDEVLARDSHEPGTGTETAEVTRSSQDAEEAEAVQEAHVAQAVPAAHDDSEAAVRVHALATRALRFDPELDFVAAVEEAKRVSLFGPSAGDL